MQLIRASMKIISDSLVFESRISHDCTVCTCLLYRVTILYHPEEFVTALLRPGAGAVEVSRSTNTAALITPCCSICLSLRVCYPGIFLGSGPSLRCVCMSSLSEL